MTSHLYDSNKAWHWFVRALCWFIVTPLRGSPYFMQPETLTRPEARNLRSFCMLADSFPYDYDVTRPALSSREER